MNNYYKAIGIRINGKYTMSQAAEVLKVNRSTVRRWGGDPSSLYSFNYEIRKVSDKRSEYLITGKQLLEIYKKRYGLPEL